VQYDLPGIVTVFTVGLLFAAARQMTQSVILCILMHATMNLVATLEAVYVLSAEGG
jgi:membrane protease YdiL (CAAX protease family)